jgi:hypothetical protein
MAQLVESRTGGAHIYKVKNPAPEMRYILKLSGGIVNMKESDYETSQTSTGPAADITFGIERHFNYKSNWYWGGRVGVGITSNTFKFDGENDVRLIDYDHYSYNGSNRYREEKYVDSKDNFTAVNLHIGPTIGLCKPISASTKLNISLTPEFVYFVGVDTRDIEREYMYYSYTVYDDGRIEGNTNGDLSSRTVDELGEIGVSGTLSVDLIFNKFTVGINGKYVQTFSYDCEYNGCPHYTIMASVGYNF